MSNHTWACFDCRISVRRIATHAGAVPCPHCGSPCECLGTKIPVPPKNSPKDWDQLRTHLGKARRQRALQIEERLAFDKEFLARQIAKLQALPANPGRSKEIRLLQKRLEALNVK